MTPFWKLSIVGKEACASDETMGAKWRPFCSFPDILNVPQISENVERRILKMCVCVQ